MKSFSPTSSLFYDEHETTQHFMPQYTSYGSVSSPAAESAERVVDAEVEDGYGFPTTTRSANDFDSRRQRKLIKMVLSTIVCAATLLWAGRATASASSSLFSARADVAPGTSGPIWGGNNLFSWKQYGQGLSNYWSQKGSEWSEIKLDLAAKVCFWVVFIFCLPLSLSLSLSFDCYLFWRVTRDHPLSDLTLSLSLSLSHTHTPFWFRCLFFPQYQPSITIETKPKNATKAEIKEAHDKFWDESKKDFKYIPDKQEPEDGDSEDEWIVRCLHSVSRVSIVASADS